MQYASKQKPSILSLYAHMNLQTALTKEYSWNKVKIMLILHSFSYIYVDKYNVILTCKGWITVCFFPPTQSPSFSFLLFISL